MKKGFTLIELLAVIIVLAIIALIATPIVLDVIEDSKKSAFKSSASMILNSANLHYAEQFMKTNNNFKGYECSIINKEGCNELSIDGEKPDTGIITINEKGRVNGKIVFGKYTYYICNNKISETETSDCNFIDYSLIYEITENGIITGLKDNEDVTNYIKDRVITIPESINGIKVNKIQTNAFSNTNITTITILSTSSVEIEQNAFPTTLEKLKVSSCYADKYIEYESILETFDDECKNLDYTSYDFDFIDEEEEFIIPSSGYYQLETWGAQGGNTNGGYGAYSTGVVYLEKGTTLYINVGGQGVGLDGGYNGGGMAAGSGVYTGAGGGGATHIALNSGQLSELSDTSSVLIISAGGGGGSYSYQDQILGGSGGGISGSNGYDGTNKCYTGTSNCYTGTGATQISGGYSNRSSSAGKGSFGLGGNYHNEGYGGSGGGAGLYGGGGSSRGNHGGGGGGSSYIASESLLSYKDITKSVYCYNCTTSLDADTYTITTENHSDVAESNTPKLGNGYARIKLISLQ